MAVVSGSNGDIRQKYQVRYRWAGLAMFSVLLLLVVFVFGFHTSGVMMYVIVVAAFIGWYNGTMRTFRRPEADGLKMMFNLCLIMLWIPILMGLIFKGSPLFAIFSLFEADSFVNEIFILAYGLVLIYLVFIAWFQLFGIAWRVMYPSIVRQGFRSDLDIKVPFLQKVDNYLLRHFYIAAVAWALLVGGSFGSGFVYGVGMV